MRARAFIAALLLLAGFGCAERSGPRTPDPGSARSTPVVVLVSLDGWRWDYLDRAKTPHLRALAARGVRVDGLIPSFPSKTFPNHYTLVTGLTPEHHGIVSNVMRDPTIGPELFTMSAATSKDSRWWGGEPLWVTAIRQGRKASSMFWPGSEVEIQGVRPTEWRPYQTAYPNGERVRSVLRWLALPDHERPAFVTLYFSDVDTAGHDFGPESPEVLDAAARLDRQVGDLIRGISRLGLDDRVTLIVTADHGMAQLGADRVIILDDYIDVSTIEIIDSSPVLTVAPKPGRSVEDVYQSLHGRHPSLAVYRKADVPARLRYSAHPRIAPIVAIAEDGWHIETRGQFQRWVLRNVRRGGNHGYDPELRSMHALFIAAGPGLRAGLVVPRMRNVNVYELMCRILGLTPAPNDGDPAVTLGWMKTASPRPAPAAARPRR